MFIEDIKNDFYNLLLGNRVLLLVHYDVDAICTCKILQSLFKSDNISYTLVPVGGISELKTAYEENCEEIKFVVLVNCGGTIDLVDLLQPEEDVVFFVLDTHKPTDVCNVYSDSQVRLLHKDSEENIPNFDDIFRDDEEDGEEEEESGREGLEATMERRRERRAWEERRNTLMFNYTQFSYYGKPSGCVAVELSWVVSRGSWGCVWAGGVSRACHAAAHRLPPARLLLQDIDLQQDIARMRPHPDTTTKVVLEKDAWLPLYRVWNLESALRHAPIVGPHLKLHTASGAGRLRQLLADIGFPLQQARQSYRAMDVELRRSLVEALERAAPRHRLPPPARLAAVLHRAHSPPLAALDVVYAIMALIEHESIPRAEGFQKALSALDIECGVNEDLRLGLEAAQRALEAVVRIVNSTLSAKKLHLAGPYTYLIVHEGSGEARYVRGAVWLEVAARWAATAAGGRPLLAGGPESHGRCLLLGVPPHFDTEPRNLFGAAFEQAATKSGTAASRDHIDSSVVTLPVAQRAQFLDALTALLG